MAFRAGETAERFQVVYAVSGKDEADALERTTALRLEQTVELPAALVQDDPFLWNEVVGQLDAFEVRNPWPSVSAASSHNAHPTVHTRALAPPNCRLVHPEEIDEPRG